MGDSVHSHNKMRKFERHQDIVFLEDQRIMLPLFDHDPNSMETVIIGLPGDGIFTATIILHNHFLFIDPHYKYFLVRPA
jgi:hypothetical protein